MSNDNDADSVHSIGMAKSPPPGSPKPTFLSNGSPPNNIANGHHNNNNNNSDNEELSPSQGLPRKARERYWGLAADTDTGGGDWVIGHRDPIDPPDSPPPGMKMRGGGGGGGGVGNDDDMSEVSSQMPMMAGGGSMPRSKSRSDMRVMALGAADGKPTTAKYNNLSFWKARRMMFYRNGDPFFPGIEFIFKPGRDIVSIDALLDKLSKRMDLPRGARFVFDMAGDRKYTLDDLEDGASYVVSSFKIFKVSGTFAYLPTQRDAIFEKKNFFCLACARSSKKFLSIRRHF